MFIPDIQNNKLINIDNYKNVYIMSDIHGCKDEFYKMLDLIKFDENDLLIIIGDVIDRGNYGIELLQEIFFMKNVILLKGNHEDMMVKSMTSDMLMFKNWTDNNGGMVTYSHLMTLDKKERQLLINKVRELKEYLKIEYNGETYLLVHAGLSLIAGLELEELFKYQGDNMLWIRNRFLKSKVKTNFKIIFGHTRTNTIPYEINNNYPSYYYKDTYDVYKVLEDSKKARIWKDESGNKIGIDCGVSAGGYLATLRLNDMKEYYI